MQQPELGQVQVGVAARTLKRQRPVAYEAALAVGLGRVAAHAGHLDVPALQGEAALFRVVEAPLHGPRLGPVALLAGPLGELPPVGIGVAVRAAPGAFTPWAAHRPRGAPGRAGGRLGPRGGDHALGVADRTGHQGVGALQREAAVGVLFGAVGRWLEAHAVVAALAATLGGGQAGPLGVSVGVAVGAALVRDGAQDLSAFAIPRVAGGAGHAAVGVAQREGGAVVEVGQPAPYLGHTPRSLRVAAFTVSTQAPLVRVSVAVLAAGVGDGSQQHGAALGPAGVAGLARHTDVTAPQREARLGVQRHGLGRWGAHPPGLVAVAGPALGSEAAAVGVLVAVGAGAGSDRSVAGKGHRSGRREGPRAGGVLLAGVAALAGLAGVFAQQWPARRVVEASCGGEGPLVVAALAGALQLPSVLVSVAVGAGSTQPQIGLGPGVLGQPRLDSRVAHAAGSVAVGAGHSGVRALQWPARLRVWEALRRAPWPGDHLEGPSPVVRVTARARFAARGGAPVVAAAGRDSSGERSVATQAALVVDLLGAGVAPVAVAQALEVGVVSGELPGREELRVGHTGQPPQGSRQREPHPACDEGLADHPKIQR